MTSNKKIMIWGSYLFNNLTYQTENHRCIYSSKNSIMMLSEKYNINNFSYKGLDIYKCHKFIYTALKFDSNYSCAILELGYVDISNIANDKYTLTDFEKMYCEIIELLKIAKIDIYLMTIPPLEIMSKDLQIVYKRINKLIRNLAAKFNVELIDDNKAILKNQGTYLSPDKKNITELGECLIKNMISRKIN